MIRHTLRVGTLEFRCKPKGLFVWQGSHKVQSLIFSSVLVRVIVNCSSKAYTLTEYRLHHLLRWLSQNFSDKGKLVYMVFSREKWRFENHLGQNTPDTPHVNTVSVFLPCQHDFRRAIIPSRDIAGHLGVLFSGQAKVTNFQVAVIINQNVSWLEVTVNDSR